jgi:hypothetical protein
MKRNLLIGTSLVAAFATTVNARSATVMSDASFDANTALSSAIHIVTEGHKKLTATGKQALKAGDTDAFAAAYRAAAEKVSGKDGKEVTLAEITAELVKNPELKKLVAEHRKLVEAQVAANKKVVPAPLTDAETIAKLNAELAAIKAANEKALAEAQAKVAALKSAAEPVTADALAAAKTAADEAKAAVDASPVDAENYAELQAAAQATAKTFAELQAKYDAANTVESLRVQLADGQKAADEAKAAATANPDDAALKADAEAKAKELAELQAKLTAAESVIAAAKAKIDLQIKDAEEIAATLAATVDGLNLEVNASVPEKVLASFIDSKEKTLANARTALKGADAIIASLTSQIVVDRVAVDAAGDDSDDEVEMRDVTLADHMKNHSVTLSDVRTQLTREISDELPAVERDLAKLAKDIAAKKASEPKLDLPKAPEAKAFDNTEAKLEGDALVAAENAHLEIQQAAQRDYDAEVTRLTAAHADAMKAHTAAMDRLTADETKAKASRAEIQLKQDLIANGIDARAAYLLDIAELEATLKSAKEIDLSKLTTVTGTNGKTSAVMATMLNAAIASFKSEIATIRHDAVSVNHLETITELRNNFNELLENIASFNSLKDLIDTDVTPKAEAEEAEEAEESEGTEVLNTTATDAATTALNDLIAELQADLTTFDVTTINEASRLVATLRVQTNAITDRGITVSDQVTKRLDTLSAALKSAVNTIANVKVADVLRNLAAAKKTLGEAKAIDATINGLRAELKGLADKRTTLETGFNTLTTKTQSEIEVLTIQLTAAETSIGDAAGTSGSTDTAPVEIAADTVSTAENLRAQITALETALDTAHATLTTELEALDTASNELDAKLEEATAEQDKFVSEDDRASQGEFSGRANGYSIRTLTPELLQDLRSAFVAYSDFIKANAPADAKNDMAWLNADALDNVFGRREMVRSADSRDETPSLFRSSAYSMERTVTGSGKDGLAEFKARHADVDLSNLATAIDTLTASLQKAAADNRTFESSEDAKLTTARRALPVMDDATETAQRLLAKADRVTRNATDFPKHIAELTARRDQIAIADPAAVLNAPRPTDRDLTDAEGSTRIQAEEAQRLDTRIAELKADLETATTFLTSNADAITAAKANPAIKAHADYNAACRAFLDEVETRRQSVETLDRDVATLRNAQDHTAQAKQDLTRSETVEVFVDAVNAFFTEARTEAAELSGSVSGNSTPRGSGAQYGSQVGGGNPGLHSNQPSSVTFENDRRQPLGTAQVSTSNGLEAANGAATTPTVLREVTSTTTAQTPTQSRDVAEETDANMSPIDKIKADRQRLRALRGADPEASSSEDDE